MIPAIARPGRAPAGPEGLPRLGAEEVAQFHDQGFLALPHFTTADDVARIREVFLRLYARFRELSPVHAIDLGHEARPPEPQIPEINWALRLAPELRRSLAFARCRELAAQLLGRPVVHTGYDHAILKPPRNNCDTPWHQDQAYTEDLGRFSSVHFWIPLQAVSVEMGCMQFLPRTHLGPIVRHHRRGHRPTAHAMEADAIDTSLAVACPLPLGGATAHLPRTLHHTGPNMTDEARYAWSLEFGPRRGGWRAWLAAVRPRRR
jgi:hypothetical protein